MGKMNGFQLSEMGLKSWFFFDLLLSVDYLKALDVFRRLSKSDQVGYLRLIFLLQNHYSSTIYASMSLLASLI